MARIEAWRGQAAVRQPAPAAGSAAAPAYVSQLVLSKVQHYLHSSAPPQPPAAPAALACPCSMPSLGLCLS